MKLYHAERRTENIVFFIYAYKKVQINAYCVGIWENQDYGTVSNYSTLKTNTRHQDNTPL